MTTKKTMSEADLQNEEKSTLEILKAQPRVKFTVMPDGSGDKKIRVKINGTLWEYAVGKEQEAPEDVYAIIKARWETIEKAEKFSAANANKDMGSL